MSQPQGPTMICATNVVKPGRARIGHLGGGVTLPRTVELVTIFAAGLGMLVGLLVAAFIPVGGLQKFFMGAAFGGAAGWFAVTFSPMQGESLLTWLGLTVRTMHQQRYVEGRPVVLSVGVSVTSRQAAGRIRLMRGAVRVPEGSYDERGVARSARNRNLPDGALSVAGAFITGVQAVETLGGQALPSDHDVAANGPQRPRLATASPQMTTPEAEPDQHGGIPVVATPLPGTAQTPAPPAHPEPVATPASHPVAPAAPSPYPSRGGAAAPEDGPRLRIPQRKTSDNVGRPRKLKD